MKDLLLLKTLPSVLRNRGWGFISRKTSASILTAALASQNSEQPASSASNAVLPFEGGSLDAAVASPSTVSSVQPSETKSTVTSASPKQNNACAVAVSVKPWS